MVLSAGYANHYCNCRIANRNILFCRSMGRQFPSLFGIKICFCATLELLVLTVFATRRQGGRRTDQLGNNLPTVTQNNTLTFSCLNSGKTTLILLCNIGIVNLTRPTVLECNYILNVNNDKWEVLFCKYLLKPFCIIRAQNTFLVDIIHQLKTPWWVASIAWTGTEICDQQHFFCRRLIQSNTAWWKCIEKVYFLQNLHHVRISKFQKKGAHTRTSMLVVLGSPNFSVYTELARFGSLAVYPFFIHTM